MELLSRLLPQGAPLHLETWHLNEGAAQLPGFRAMKGAIHRG
jgi:hypothetical protein